MDVNAIFKDYIIPFIAILAFILSLYNAYRQWKENRPKPVLELFRKEYDENEQPDPGFACQVRNIGKGHIIVDLAGFHYKKG